MRQHLGETVLVVANLSRFAQYTELDLSRHKGAMPVELFGKARFPAVGEAPYPLSLGPHGFYWFSLERPKATDERLSMPPPPAVLVCASLDSLLTGDERAGLEEALPHFLEGRRWYAGRDRTLRAAHLEDVIRIGKDADPLYFAFVRVEYLDAAPELYALPLAWVRGEAVPPGVAVVAHVRVATDDSQGALVDATDDPASALALLDAIAREQRSVGRAGELVASAAGHDALVPVEGDVAGEPRKIGSERHHTTIRYGDRYVLRCVRRIDEGISPELEVSRFLAARGADIAPRLRGALELVRAPVGPMAVATLYDFVPSTGTAWQLTVDELRRYFERVLARSSSDPCPAVPAESPLLLAGDEPPMAVREMMGSYGDVAGQIGVRVAELHLALAGADGDPAFTPEPYSALDRRSKYQSLRNLSGKVFRALREALPSLAPPTRLEAASIAAREADVARSFEPLIKAKMSGLRIRTHGDLHLGHVLHTGKSFVVTDFNGLEVLTLGERRRKRSPLRDLAWMVRSFHIAAFRRLFDPASVREADVDAARPWAVHWASWASAAFLDAYMAKAAGAPFLPTDRDQSAVLFDAFVLEQALYQLRSDLEERSPGVMVSLLGIAHSLREAHPR